MIGYGYAEGVVERGVDLEQAIWEVNVGGNIHRAEIHKQSLYDPTRIIGTGLLAYHLGGRFGLCNLKQ